LLTCEIVGCAGLCEKLHVTVDRGLTPTDFEERANLFGSNYKAPPKITPYWRLFLGALEDFMLRFLLVCAVVELSIEVGFADSHERRTGKFSLGFQGVMLGRKLTRIEDSSVYYCFFPIYFMKMICIYKLYPSSKYYLQSTRFGPT
jgi:magnesium-transporting ATPase (P-type)